MQFSTQGSPLYLRKLPAGVGVSGFSNCLCSDSHARQYTSIGTIAAERTTPIAFSRSTSGNPSRS